MMHKNVGNLDRYLRLTFGLYLLGHGINRHSSFWTMMGAMKVAEGVTRFCPVLSLLGVSTVEKQSPDAMKQHKSKTKGIQRVKRAVRKLAEEI